MHLAPGTRLGPYEIVSPLGAGGMGEVYRAKDTRLGRDVAVKVLPEHLSANPEVRARFEREAKTISALNHPHICTLFDVGREGETDFLVMELVEGETLAERLMKGALPAADVLKLGAQIADGLDRAHRAGVVHRDLKPGNVMLTKSGAKIVDFGLARSTAMAGPVSASGATMSALTHSPTVASPLTAEGTIVGTFQYMSPEQLEGREADARSDIWALGCVLYEMATGRRAFEGKSQASLITAIMSSEPLSVSQIAPMAPAGLDRLVRTCLTKDPDERVRTAHDVRLQLEGLAEGGSQSAIAAPAAARRTRSSLLPWAIAAAASLAAVALALVLALASRQTAPKNAILLSLLPPGSVTFGQVSSNFSIAPDGRSVAFSATDSSNTFGVWVRRFDSPEATRLTTSKAGAHIFWSPDSRSVGLLGAGQIMTVPVTGGSPATICDAPSPRGATWNQAGVIVFAPAVQGPLFRVAASGGEAVQVSWPDSARHEASHRFPCFLPDGEHFLFAALPPGPDGFEIYAGSLGSRDVRKIITAESAPTYTAPGYLLSRRSGKVMAQRFDAGRLELVGDPMPLADAPPVSNLDAEPVARASDDGRLVFLDAPIPNTQLGWFDRTGALQDTLPLPAGRWGRPVLSPDDRAAVASNGDDLWRVDLARAVASRLTANDGVDGEPVWSPDGARIAFCMSRLGQEEIQIVNADGSGEPQMVPTTTDLFKAPTAWAREGLIITNWDERTLGDLWIHPLSADGRATPLIQTQFTEAQAAISPDGRWIAYLSNEAGKDDIYIQSFPVPGHKVRVSTGGAQRPSWMPGSDEICYRSGIDMMTVKLTRRGEDLEVGTPQVLFRFPLGVGGMDFSHDGARVLASFSNAEQQQDRTLRVILDWTAMVKR